MILSAMTSGSTSFTLKFRVTLSSGKNSAKVQHHAHTPLVRGVFHELKRDLPEHTFYGSVCLSEWIKVLDAACQSYSGTWSFFSIKNIRKNEDLVLAFSPRVLPKGRSMLAQMHQGIQRFALIYTRFLPATPSSLLTLSGGCN